LGQNHFPTSGIWRANFPIILPENHSAYSPVRNIERRRFAVKNDVNLVKNNLFLRHPPAILLPLNALSIKEKTMKTARLIALLTIAATCMASAATNVVSSANVVGYNQITIPSNQYVLVSLGFNNESNTINGLFGSLPVGSTIHLWDTLNQRWNSNSKDRSGWGTAGTNKITIGTGAFVELPVNVQTNIYFSGDVPTAGTSAVYKVNGYGILAYPYPADVAFTNTVLAKNAAVGDEVSFWSNGWVSYSKDRSGWAGAENVKIQVGQAFFYKSSSGSAVNEIKPYTLD